MTHKYIDGIMLKNMIFAAAINLENNKTIVNALNVFPVPDGDTGTNMSLTMLSAVNEIKGLSNFDISSVADAAANGSLMGARGNSGVILSQILRGISKIAKKSENIDIKDFANALAEGSATAYKAIMKPTEGTILTVIREAADYGLKIADNCASITVFLDEVIEKANEVLDATPEMLTVLKNAGVVDAGGKGLLYILEGMLEFLETGILIEEKEVKTENAPQAEVEKTVYVGDEIEFGYCTEFFIRSKKTSIEEVREVLTQIGDSLVVAGNDSLIKVHVHTNNPGKALEMAMKFGELSKIKIDNMREQHRELYTKEEEYSNNATTVSKKYGVISVVAGEGLKNIFTDMGVDRVVEGGQTMNPSTEDILNCVKSINAEHIIILPNNSNVILAANQVKNLSDKSIAVIPSKDVPQGIAAFMALNNEKDLEENVKKMEKAISKISTGLVTYAVRDSKMDGISIEEGNILGISAGKIVSAGKDIKETCEALLENMVDEDTSLISVYYGSDVSEESANELKEQIEEKYFECDVELQNGGQPVYYYIISVE